MSHARLQTSGFQLGLGIAGDTSQGYRTMWLPPALLLLCLPGERGWGLGSLLLQEAGQEVEGVPWVQARSKAKAEMGRTHPSIHLNILLCI